MLPEISDLEILVFAGGKCSVEMPGLLWLLHRVSQVPESSQGEVFEKGCHVFYFCLT